MSQTYIPLATTTLSSSSASVTFSSISSAYTDLVLVVNLKGDVAGFAPRMRFNNDSSTNYSWVRMSGSGSAVSSARVSSATSINIGSTANVYTTDGFVGICQIQNYANATTFKTTLNRGNNATDGTEAIVGLWRDTSAINRVDVVNTASANFNSGSTLTLYGIKAA